MSLPYEKYTSDDYLKNNPTWDSEDSPWKAAFVAEMLRSAGLSPASICEVGCGAGGVLSELRRTYPHAELYGFDIAPDASSFWDKYKDDNINFQVGNFFELNDRTYDVVLLLDVVEHLADPHKFLTDLRGSAGHYIFHIPLDLSALSVLREKPITYVRDKVGHIHYFTKNLALSLVRECGFEVVRCKYTGATFNAPRRTWKTALASLPRGLAYLIDKDWGVRALGGETLVVLAKGQEGQGDG